MVLGLLSMAGLNLMGPNRLIELGDRCGLEGKGTQQSHGFVGY